MYAVWIKCCNYTLLLKYITPNVDVKERHEACLSHEWSIIEEEEKIISLQKAM